MLHKWIKIGHAPDMQMLCTHDCWILSIIISAEFTFYTYLQEKSSVSILLSHSYPSSSSKAAQDLPLCSRQKVALTARKSTELGPDLKGPTVSLGVEITL